LLDKLKEIPKVGDKIEFGSIKMVVEEVVNNQANRIKIEKET
jgi:CBS domain containing-hemolysin-like protein